MNRSEADRNSQSNDTPRVEETGLHLGRPGRQARKPNLASHLAQNVRQRAVDSSSSSEKGVGECAGEFTKRRRVNDSSSSCGVTVGARGEYSYESSSSSEDIEEKSSNVALRKRLGANDSSSSCDNTDEGSGEEQQIHSNLSIHQQNRWESMFARLIDFKEKHGHCLVPNRFEEDRSLGAWVSTQRRHYKLMASKNFDQSSTPLTKERIQKLRDVGFVWATSDPRHTPWDVRFNELRDYREKFGKSTHCASYQAISCQFSIMGT